MYGKSKYAAGFEIFQNLIIVRRITAQRTISSPKANPGLWKPKKIIGQEKFKASWTKKRLKAFLFLLALNPFIQIKYNEIPMRT